MKWVGMTLLLFMVSPFFVFGHALILSTQSDEFISSMLLSVVILTFAGLHTGIAFASGMEGIESASSNPLSLSYVVTLFVFSMLFFWNGSWIIEKDLTQLAGEGGWAPLSIFSLTAITTLLAHRAIVKMLAGFGLILNFQNDVWEGVVGWFSKKTYSSLCWIENRVFRQIISGGVSNSLNYIASFLSSFEQTYRQRVLIPSEKTESVKLAP